MLFQLLKERLALKSDAKVRKKSETTKYFLTFFSFYPKNFHFLYKNHQKLYIYPYFGSFFMLTN
jgi:hypothetical protein